MGSESSKSKIVLFINSELGDMRVEDLLFFTSHFRPPCGGVLPVGPGPSPHLNS